MARFADREKALELRKKGMSYSQIKTELRLSKSTLSLWLRDYPLSRARIAELRDKSAIRIEKFRETMKKKHDARLSEVYKNVKPNLSFLTEKEFLLAGLGLYWGEGTKSGESAVGLTNTDPAVIKFFIKWLNRIYKVPRNALKVFVHLYIDMDQKKELAFWSKTLSIPKQQFGKPYIKNSPSNRINHKGAFGHGTCKVTVYGVPLKEKIMMQLKVLVDFYTNPNLMIGNGP